MLFVYQPAYFQVFHDIRHSLVVVIAFAYAQDIHLAIEAESAFGGYLFFCGHLYPQGYGCPLCKIQFHLQLSYLAVEIVYLTLVCLCFSRILEDVGGIGHELVFSFVDYQIDKSDSPTFDFLIRIGSSRYKSHILI